MLKRPLKLTLNIAKLTAVWGNDKNLYLLYFVADLSFFFFSHAYFCLNKYEEAVESYEKGLELDPNNATLKSSLATAKSKVNTGSVERSAESPSTSPAGGLPNLGAGGGMPDLGSLLNNPALMNMAQQMMQSGALDGLMNNPNIARM